MKRWQSTLMTVVLLTLALVLFMGVSALLLVQIGYVDLPPGRIQPGRIQAYRDSRCNGNCDSIKARAYSLSTRLRRLIIKRVMKAPAQNVQSLPEEQRAASSPTQKTEARSLLLYTISAY